MSHTFPTSCSSKDARVKVRPPINVMTGVTDEAKTARVRRMKGDEPEEEEGEKKGPNVIENTSEGKYKDKIEMQFFCD